MTNKSAKHLCTSPCFPPGPPLSKSSFQNNCAKKTLMNQHPIIKNNCFFPLSPCFSHWFSPRFSSIPTCPGLQFRLRFHLPQHSASAPPRRRREGGAQGGQGQGQGTTWGGHGKVPVQRCEQLGFTGEILKTWWFQMVQDILNLFLFRDWRNVIQYGSKLQTDL
jgi:hypothetical protein